MPGFWRRYLASLTDAPRERPSSSEYVPLVTSSPVRPTRPTAYLTYPAVVVDHVRGLYAAALSEDELIGGDWYTSHAVAVTLLGYALTYGPDSETVHLVVDRLRGTPGRPASLGRVVPHRAEDVALPYPMPPRALLNTTQVRRPSTETTAVFQDDDDDEPEDESPDVVRPKTHEVTDDHR